MKQLVVVFTVIVTSVLANGPAELVEAAANEDRRSRMGEDVADFLLRLPKKRWISQIAHGLVAPQGWQPGKGFKICLWNGAPVAGKMPHLVIVNVWFMDVGYGGRKLPEGADEPAEELIKWQGRRVLALRIQGDLKNWPDYKGEILGALKAGETPPVTSKAKPADAEVRERRHVIAESDEFSLRLVTRSDWTFGPLVVYEKAGDKLVCKIPASSQRILVDFAQQRIVIMNKAFGPGQLDFDRRSPVRGGIVFSMTGEKKGVIPGDVYKGALFDGVFIGLLRSGGMVAYDIGRANEIWRNKEAKFAHEWKMIGPNMLYGRRNMPSRQGGGLEAYVVDTTTGKTMFRKAAKVTEHLRIVAADAGHCVTVKNVEGREPPWISEILDVGGKERAIIEWRGDPVKVVLAKSGTKVMAVYQQREGKNRKRYVLECRSLDGKELWQKNLLSTVLADSLRVDIQEEGMTCRVRLLKGEEVKANVAVEEVK